MGDDIVIYWGSGSGPCWRALICLEEKGVKYESKLISFGKKEHKSDEVMAINPRGQVPALKHGNVIVNESLAICHYVEEEFKGQGNALLPANKQERALTLQRMYEALNLERKDAELYYPVMMNKQDLIKDRIPTLRQNIKDELAIWEGHLDKSDGEFLTGKNFTMADAVFFAVLAFACRMGLSLDSRPKMKAYYEAVSQRPSVKATWPPHWHDGPSGVAPLSDI